jgi:O-acetyl-ADP-ribose deacetylase (regulator of RNase III)
MISYQQGDLLSAKVDALVNAVNTVGVMGKGIALSFKKQFPDNYRQYAAACAQNKVQVGEIFITQNCVAPKWIVNFPTKQHWRDPSQLQWIVEGLQSLKKFIITNQVKSIALPALGAGNGGLDWTAVREQIERTLGDLQADVHVYEPLNQQTEKKA